MKVIYRLTTHGLVVEPVSPVIAEAPQILATSAKSSKLAQSELLASNDVDGELCKFRKGFLDQFKPRAFVMSVSAISVEPSSKTCLQKEVGYRVFVLSNFLFVIIDNPCGDATRNFDLGELHVRAVGR